jgi:hypothetical protein
VSSTIQEKNRLANIYRREAREMGQVSPFRQSLFIKSRIKGKTKEEALIISRNKKGVLSA